MNLKEVSKDKTYYTVAFFKGNSREMIFPIDAEFGLYLSSPGVPAKNEDIVVFCSEESAKDEVERWFLSKYIPIDSREFKIVKIKPVMVEKFDRWQIQGDDQ